MYSAYTLNTQGDNIQPRHREAINLTPQFEKKKKKKSKKAESSSFSASSKEPGSLESYGNDGDPDAPSDPADGEDGERPVYNRRTGRKEPTNNVRREGETPGTDVGAEEQTSLPEEEGAGRCAGRADRDAEPLRGRGQPLSRTAQAVPDGPGPREARAAVRSAHRMGTGSS